MLKHPELTEQRIRQTIEHIVRPAIYRTIAPLEIEVFQCADPINYEEAVGQEYKPCKVGFRWGPFWSTAWFRMKGRIPTDETGNNVAALINTGSEALLWMDGAPWRGLNRDHHTEAFVASPAAGGEELVLYVEAACNDMFGIRKPGPMEPYPDKPAQLSMAELAVRRQDVWDLYHDMNTLYDLMIRLPMDGRRRPGLRFGLNEAVNLLNPDDVPGTAAAAREPLKALLAKGAQSTAGRASIIGNSHIDTAWLWPLRETIRKCGRTFSTVLHLMERHPDYLFIQSQAQLYQYTKDRYPRLYERIGKAVKDGKWEAAGAMWVEADCNVPSGESLVRQVLHGQRFFQKEFGVQGEYLWLPDVFGYSAALPQILCQSGVPYFITQKISWNKFNKFPNHTFWWEGIDGTKIFSHFLPADTYVGNMMPEQVVHGERNFAERDRCENWLYVFGWGDGGGGPTPQMIETARRCENLDGMPKLKWEFVGEFLKRAAKEAKDLPTWVGELYLEYHRGTYTTQARNKRGNRKSELLLRDVEIMCALNPGKLDFDPMPGLDKAWKLVLLNQFHDILPGSSITWVYEDALKDYATIKEMGSDLLARAQKAWADAIDTTGTTRPVAVWNTLSWDRSDVVALPASGLPDANVVKTRLGITAPVQKVVDSDGSEKLIFEVDRVPSMGHTVVDLGAEPAYVPPMGVAVGPEGDTLENEHLRVKVNLEGQLVSLYDKAAAREVLDASNPANQLVLYDDRSTSADAWDVDAFYLEKPLTMGGTCEVKVVETGPVRASILVERKFGKSVLKQWIRLCSGAKRVDFDTVVDWKEDRKFLRALFPVKVYSPRATFEIQYGSVERPTHFNTSWDIARFEVPAQQWVDLSEGDYGVAVLNDCKYGHSVHGNVIGMSLLRATTSPDPVADRATHYFSYSVMPHKGDWRQGRVVCEAYQFNIPLLAAPVETHQGYVPPRWSAVTIEPQNMVVTAVKPSEESPKGEIILRAYEAHGTRGEFHIHWHDAPAAVVAADPIERRTRKFKIRHSARDTSGEFTPFAIRTLLVSKEKGAPKPKKAPRKPKQTEAPATRTVPVPIITAQSPAVAVERREPEPEKPESDGGK
ncbi:MAG TPA: glycoside hydrolase family 38 C-terminal domain-containing protein [Candidatus Brocadiia bacterium]|nr:glycoside hydrolase family 38 C-terminal domain-containing protein [Candidatus Brocadiia bacterium]